MSAPRFPVIEAPAGGAAFGFAHAVMRRAVSKLPLALVLLAVTYLAFRIDYLGRVTIGVDITEDWWKESLFIQAVFIGCIVLAVVAADELVARGARRWPTYAAALVVGCGVAAWAQDRLVAWIGWNSVIDIPELVLAARPLQLFFYGLVYSTFGCFVYVNRRTAMLAAKRMHAAELARATARRRTLESRLQAMQARIEPQFLFNTLAHVRDLYEQDAGAAGRMLDDLIAYLRAALPHLRESSSTLGREIDLARAYLDIVRVRLGDRLAVEIDVPESLRSGRVPALTLLPLIDHALARRQHAGGSGGTIRIEGTTLAVRLRIAITDEGNGSAHGHSGGDGDSDGEPTGIGERLQALYGTDAHFAFERLDDGNTRATLEIPYEATDLRDR